VTYREWYEKYFEATYLEFKDAMDEPIDPGEPLDWDDVMDVLAELRWACADLFLEDMSGRTFF
jgi:hypothetical protein